jgi:low temperature requirement protein LtrA
MQLHVRMSSRDPDEAHRASTPLELFFDLTFVVAIAEAGASLHHGLVSGHATDALVSYPLVFFGIWWAWMNFTWFASAYDTDDATYRLAVLAQMIGVLILAVGVPRAMSGSHFTILTWGYVVMRLPLIAQWLRAAASDPEARPCALRYAVGVGVVQIGWMLRLLLAREAGLVAFPVLVALELAVPIWAEAAGRTSWHPGHIAERYGLFTIIVLGEALSAAAFAVQAALDEHASIGDLATVIVGGMLVVFSMWWFYFDMPAGQVVGQVRHAFGSRLSGAFAWGYGHYVVFLSAAAVGAGLAVAVDQALHQSQLTDREAGFAVTVPAAAYLLTVWGLHVRYKPSSWMRNYAVPITVALVLISSFTPEPVLITGGLMAALVAINIVVGTPSVASRRPSEGDRISG